MLRAKSALIRSSVLFGLTAGIVPLTNTAQGTVLYGTFVGPNMTYQNVTETPTELPAPTPTTLFGTPLLSGDSLMFTPAAFVTSASGGALNFEDSHLETTIVPTSPKGTLTGMSITEGGGWAVGGGTAATTAEAALIVNQLFIMSVNGVSINPIVVTPVILFTDTSTGSAAVTKTADSIEFNSSGGFSSGSWNATATFNISSALASAGLTGTVTGVSLNLDNQLDVLSETNSDAFIDKKFFDITTTGTTVPEPATGTALLLGAAGLMTRRGKRAELLAMDA